MRLTQLFPSRKQADRRLSLLRAEVAGDSSSDKLPLRRILPNPS